MIELYTDGGCAIKNPSSHGISWAFCIVRNGSVLFQDSGSITTSCCGKFKATNNLAEMIAVVKGLEYAKKEFSNEKVIWCTDSEITRNRLLGGYSLDKLPRNVVSRGLAVRGIVHSGRLIKGHPTKKELKAGVSKEGKPVSEFNVLVDKLCKKQASNLLLNKGD